MPFVYNKNGMEVVYEIHFKFFSFLVFIFYVIYLFFPEAFHTLVSWADKTF